MTVDRKPAMDNRRTEPGRNTSNTPGRQLRDPDPIDLSRSSHRISLLCFKAAQLVRCFPLDSAVGSREELRQVRCRREGGRRLSAVVTGPLEYAGVGGLVLRKVAMNGSSVRGSWAGREIWNLGGKRVSPMLRPAARRLRRGPTPVASGVSPHTHGPRNN